MSKAKRGMVLLLAALVGAVLPAAAQSERSSPLAIEGRVGALVGPSGDDLATGVTGGLHLHYAFTRRLAAQAGYSYMGFSDARDTYRMHGPEAAVRTVFGTGRVRPYLHGGAGVKRRVIRPEVFYRSDDLTLLYQVGGGVEYALTPKQLLTPRAVVAGTVDWQMMLMLKLDVGLRLGG